MEVVEVPTSTAGRDFDMDIDVDWILVVGGGGVIVVAVIGVEVGVEVVNFKAKLCAKDRERTEEEEVQEVKLFVEVIGVKQFVSVSAFASVSRSEYLSGNEFELELKTFKDSLIIHSKMKMCSVWWGDRLID